MSIVEPAAEVLQRAQEFTRERAMIEASSTTKVPMCPYARWPTTAIKNGAVIFEGWYIGVRPPIRKIDPNMFPWRKYRVHKLFWLKRIDIRSPEVVDITIGHTPMCKLFSNGLCKGFGKETGHGVVF